MEGGDVVISVLTLQLIYNVYLPAPAQIHNAQTSNNQFLFFVIHTFAQMENKGKKHFLLKHFLFLFAKVTKKKETHTETHFL